MEFADMSSEQLDLFNWKPPRGPAEIIPFPFHRSDGCTAALARRIVGMKRPKRTGVLNSLRNQTRKELEPLLGAERAEIATDLYISAIRRHFLYFDRGYGERFFGPDGPSAA